MKLHEIIHIGEVETKRGYVITKNNIRKKDMKNLVKEFFGYNILKENEEVKYVNYTEKILGKDNCYIINRGELFIEDKKMFVKNNNIPMIFVPESEVIIKDMTNNY